MCGKSRKPVPIWALSWPTYKPPKPILWKSELDNIKTGLAHMCAGMVQAHTNGLSSELGTIPKALTKVEDTIGIIYTILGTDIANPDQIDLGEFGRDRL